MNKQEVYALLNQNPVFHLATLEGDQPRVRGMLLYRADENGILFHTAAMKPVCQQMRENPKVELCFWDMNQNVQVRVSGLVEMVEDKALKDEIYAHPSRAFLKGWKENGALEDFYHSFVVFRLRHGQVTSWTMETNFAEKAIVYLD